MQAVHGPLFDKGVFRRAGGGFSFRPLTRKQRYSEEASGDPGRPEFEVSVIKTREERAQLAAMWASMLAASPSPEKLYLSPAFFSYLEENPDPQQACALFVVRDRSDGAIAGIVPVRLRELPLEFRAGPFGSLRLRLRTVQILGSVPMLPNQPWLLEYVAGRILVHFASAGAVSMQAVPAELFGRFAGMERLRPCVLDGWRDCHTMPLPESFEQYLQKFSAKKRYNLGRQVKLLVKEAGKLEVTRVERPEHVDELVAAVQALAPGDKAAFPNRHRFEQFAACGLLLSYVVKCGGEYIGAVVASNGGDKWHVHNIFSAAKYQHLSAGTSTLHVVLEDVIDNFPFSEADFGYGTPNRDFRSTHQLRTRGHVLLYRPGRTTAFLLACQTLYSGLYERVASTAKRAKRNLMNLRTRRAGQP